MDPVAGLVEYDAGREKPVDEEETRDGAEAQREEEPPWFLQALGDDNHQGGQAPADGRNEGYDFKVKYRRWKRRVPIGIPQEKGEQAGGEGEDKQASEVGPSALQAAVRLMPESHLPEIAQRGRRLV